MPDVAHTGGMIALVPTSEHAATLAVDGGDPADELHLTLAYLGDDVTEWPPEHGTEVATDLRDLAAQLAGPVTGAVFARAEFNHNGDDGREPCAVYLVGDSPSLDGLRRRAEELVSDRIGVPTPRSPFVAHITGGFGIPADRLTYTGPVAFDRLRLALAGQVTDVPLSVFTAPPPEEKTGHRSAFSTKGDFVSDVQAKAAPAPAPAKPAAAQPPAAAPAKQQRTPGKRYVASAAGAARYGKPIGTELGTSRGGKAADDAQKDPGAKENYKKLMAMKPAARAKYINSLSDDELKKLTAVTYSFKSSNTEVVAARNAMASALRKRGFDPADHGSLAPRTKGKTGTAAKKKATTTAKKKGSMSDAEDAAWRRKASESGGRLNADDLSDAALKKLIAAGWKGDPNDGTEAIYPPKKGADVGIEVKAGKSDAKRESMAKGPRAMSDGSYAIETIGDLAKAIKGFAKAPADKKDKLKSHITSNAKRLKATNMLPADWPGSTKGKPGKKGSGFVPFTKGGKKSLDDLDFDIETKVMSQDPRARRLRKYWSKGEGRAKWDTFRQLRSLLSKHVPPTVLNGLTANIYKEGKGHWPGRGRKDAEAGVEVSVISADELKAAMTMLDDEDVDLDKAMDDHAAKVDDITSEAAYEQSLSDEVEWDIAADGEIAPVGDGDGDADDANWDDPEWDGIDDGPESFDDLDFGPEDGAEGDDLAADPDAEKPGGAPADEDAAGDLAALDALFGDGDDDEDDED